MKTLPKIFCAIDTPDVERALKLAGSVVPLGIGLKLGLEFFNSCGPDGVQKIKTSYSNAALFLDLKFHDIPNTVAGAVKAISDRFKPAYLNVHASGGAAMMEAAINACNPATKLLGVTVLTSMDEESLSAVGQGLSPMDQVHKLGRLAQESGMAGIVCSAHEIEMLRRVLGSDFILMVPGIRPLGADTGDQKRVMTPAEAIQKGANHLVIGRPITGANDPAAAARDIQENL
jgi:orotidine-5'-phosphate decarboxylase